MARPAVHAVHGTRDITESTRPLRRAQTFHRRYAKMSFTDQALATIVTNEIGETFVGFSLLGIFDNVYFVTQLSFISPVALTIKDVVFNRAITMNTAKCLARGKRLVHCSPMSPRHALNQRTREGGHGQS